MSYERLFEGKVSQFDRNAKTLTVMQEMMREEKSHPVNRCFTLDPNVVITTRSRGTLGFGYLKAGQKVIVHYITRPIDKRIAKTIVVITPLVWP